MLKLLRVVAVLAYLTGDGPDDRVPPESSEGRQALVAHDVAHDLCRACDVTQAWYVEMRWGRKHCRACRAAPPSSDFLRLPPREEVERNWRFAAEWYWRHGGDAEAYGAWHLLREAYDATYLADRRLKLAELRKAIGPRAYYLGAMPAPAPWHLFEERE